jgi:hypothetical protein
VPKGDYRLRVAASDTDGRLGAVNYDFSAAIAPAGPLDVSGVMVGLSSAAGGFGPRLEFDGADQATAYFEIYADVRQATDLSVAWELAETPDGPALAQVPGVVLPTPDEDRFSARGQLPLRNLAHGDYVVRATVSLKGKVAGRLTRTVRCN